MGNTAVGMQDNTTRDHFWNVGSFEDGRHRYVCSPSFTIGGNPADPDIGNQMNGVFYLKETSDRAEWFHHNDEGIYQATPSFLEGSHAVTGSFTNILTVPENVYGEIFMYLTVGGNPVAGKLTAQWGFFRSNTLVCDAWSQPLAPDNDPSRLALRFGNGSQALGLNIRVRTSSGGGSIGTWAYRIIYRAL